MDEGRKMRLLMLDDEEVDCNRFKNYINTRTDVELVAATSSCEEALQYVKNDFIEGVIVDIELPNGKGGSGLDFLKALDDLRLDLKPLLFLNTKNSNPRTHDAARNFGIEMVFVKNQNSYSEALVINTFLMYRETLYHGTQNSEAFMMSQIAKADGERMIENKINVELDHVGISTHLLGRKYVFDAILFLLQSKGKGESYLAFLKEKYGKSTSSIGDAAQSAINKAWARMPYDELEKHFTAKIHYKNGSPTPVEFIYYYVDKIKRMIS